jgi:hypothetical protein
MLMLMMLLSIWFEPCVPWSRSFGRTVPMPPIKSSAGRVVSF